MRNIAVRLRYCGTNYHGWQIQKGLDTVCGMLQRAVEKTVEHKVSVVGCGRTDAGVHAETYVANFRTTSRIPLERLPLALNSRLPEDIAVLSAAEVGEDFNAIGSCIKKQYTYRIYNGAVRDPLLNDRAMFYPVRLDERLMQEAAKHFIGEKDFAAVRSVGTPVKSTVRRLYDCRVTRNGDVIEITVSANGFLYNMARAIAGTLLYVAEGKIKAEEIDSILESGNRTLAGPTLPACGLYMTGVWYNEEV